MSATQTEHIARFSTPCSAILEPVPAELAARLANDWVLRTLGVGVSTGSGHDQHRDADHHLLMHWRAPHIGAEVAIQQFSLCVRRSDGSYAPSSTAHALIRRAAVVLTTRATWSELPITRIAEHRGDADIRTFSVLYHIAAGD